MPTKNEYVCMLRGLLNLELQLYGLGAAVKVSEFVDAVSEFERRFALGSSHRSNRLAEILGHEERTAHETPSTSDNGLNEIAGVSREVLNRYDLAAFAATEFRHSEEASLLYLSRDEHADFLESLETMVPASNKRPIPASFAELL